jgi:hypothetical protein
VADAHVRHVLTAIAVNIERLSTQEPDDDGPARFYAGLDLRPVGKFSGDQAVTELDLASPFPCFGSAGQARRNLVVDTPWTVAQSRFEVVAL